MAEPRTEEVGACDRTSLLPALRSSTTRPAGMGLSKDAQSLCSNLTYKSSLFSAVWPSDAAPPLAGAGLVGGRATEVHIDLFASPPTRFGSGPRYSIRGQVPASSALHEGRGHSGRPRCAANGWTPKFG
jgi:hypothetical protein